MFLPQCLHTRVHGGTSCVHAVSSSTSCTRANLRKFIASSSSIGTSKVLGLPSFLALTLFSRSFANFAKVPVNGPPLFVFARLMVVLACVCGVVTWK